MSSEDTYGGFLQLVLYFVPLTFSAESENHGLQILHLLYFLKALHRNCFPSSVECAVQQV